MKYNFYQWHIYWSMLDIYVYWAQRKMVMYKLNRVHEEVMCIYPVSCGFLTNLKYKTSSFADKGIMHNVIS